MTSQPPTPTGTAGADLLLLELAETVPSADEPDEAVERVTQSDRQVLDHLNEMMIEFAGRMEMAFVTTADDSGECECSLRSGPPGFVRVLADRTLAYPAGERDEMTEPVQLALLMMADDLTGLHVTGTAGVVTDADLRAEHPDLPADDAPERWVLVLVERAAVRAALPGT